jgi:hypothetical protein
MTGPLEMQTALIRPTDATRNVSHQLNAQDAAQQSLALEMAKKAKESTHTTNAPEKTAEQHVQDSLEKESERNLSQNPGKKREEEKQTAKKNDDGFRGNFLDVRG